MPLSAEDNLRLQVLLRQQLKAIRINESTMTVHALTELGEAKVSLNPNANDEAYLKLVRQLLSTHILGSPAGYPVFLKRWTRMGQERSDESLKQLLLLGENEALAAVVHAPVISAEIASRAWWVAPNSENARRMLEKETVAKSDLGPKLAEFLLEFLPFEEDQQAMIDSVKLVLQPGLIDAESRQRLWARGRNRVSFFIGFLHSIPDQLPDQSEPSPTYLDLCQSLAEWIEAGEPFALQLRRLASPSGQVYLHTCERVIKKLNNQDATVALFDCIEHYFESVCPDDNKRRTIDEVLAAADAYYADSTTLSSGYSTCLPCQRKIKAIMILAMVSEQLLAPIFGKTDAIGSVMRKKLLPVTNVLVEQLHVLQD